MAEKKYVIQEVVEVYEHESAEGGYDYTQYRDINFRRYKSVGPFGTVEEAETYLDVLLDDSPHSNFRIDTRYEK